MIMVDKKHILIFLTLAIVASGTAGCVRQKAASITTTSGIESPADERIKKAGDLVNKMPELAKYHVQLAAAILGKVRETGDYSLNRKAEESLSKALAIEPDNFDAQILQTQIYLSEHNFREGLELAKKLEVSNP